MMKMCELLYNFGLREHNETLPINVFREWKRYAKFNANKQS